MIFEDARSPIRPTAKYDLEIEGDRVRVEFKNDGKRSVVPVGTATAGSATGPSIPSHASESVIGIDISKEAPWIRVQPGDEVDISIDKKAPIIFIRALKLGF